MSTEFVKKDDVLYYSRHLEDSIVICEIIVPDGFSSESFFDWKVVSALEEWTTATAPQILCVAGPSEFKEPCAATLVASQCRDLAMQSEIPVISFFCRLPRQNGSLPWYQTRESIALISLTYSLIRQLAELLPSTTMPSLNSFSQQRFALLDGSPDSLDDALKLLGELLDRAPSVLLCVIDGFQWLDDRSTRGHLENFLEALRGHGKMEKMDPESPDRLLKILFTTAGESRCLLDRLSREELIFAEGLGVSPRPGRVNRARRSLSPRLLEDLRQPTENESDWHVLTVALLRHIYRIWQQFSLYYNYLTWNNRILKPIALHSSSPRHYPFMYLTPDLFYCVHFPFQFRFTPSVCFHQHDKNIHRFYTGYVLCCFIRFQRLNNIGFKWGQERRYKKTSKITA